MKLNKSSILALMTLGGLMAFGPLASADDSSTKPVPPPDAPSTPPSDATPPAGGRRGGAMNLDKMAEQLKLTDDQKEKVKPVLKDMQTKMRALRQDTSITPEDRRPKMKEIRDDTDTKLKTILSADQYAQWQKMAQQARGGRRKNATPPPADSSTTPPASNDNK